MRLTTISYFRGVKMRKFTKADLEKLEGYWINLNQLKKDMRFREWELLNPHQENEKNVGGKGSNISNPTENKAIILAEDREYQNLKSIIETIEKLFDELDEEQKVIVQMRYQNTKDCYEWQHIADELGMSVQRVLRKRKLLIDETAKRIGWV